MIALRRAPDGVQAGTASDAHARNERRLARKGSGKKQSAWFFW